MTLIGLVNAWWMKFWIFDVGTNKHGWCLTNQHEECIVNITNHKCGCECHGKAV